MSPLSEHHNDLSTTQREALVIDHLWLADALARRYAGRGEEPDDLSQVARVGLVHAAQRYDPGQGDFVPFAAPTVTGEVKRHFRDHGWLIRPPRRTQELQAQVDTALGELTQVLSREPSTYEIAALLDVRPADVAEARTARSSYHGVSLDRPYDDASCLVDSVGADDPEYERSEWRTMLQQACSRLSPGDRELLRQRFVEERSQRDIAQELNTHQMAVSRRLTRIMSELRNAMDHNLRGEPTGRRPQSARRRRGARAAA